GRPGHGQGHARRPLRRGQHRARVVHPHGRPPLRHGRDDGLTRHYLDHASTSPLRPEAAGAMRDWLARSADGQVADPGRIHAEGLAARYEIESAREAIAALLGARSREVVLTSGATEAIATAVWGAAERGPHAVVTAV